MIKTWLAATTALTLMSGMAVAQSESSTTTSTQYSAPLVMPAPGSVTESTTRTTTDSNGVQTETDKTVTRGVAVSPFGDTTTTRKTTETTTVR
jgi:ABC-type Fe3+-hydroxamate transport system substrate-binding protein